MSSSKNSAVQKRNERFVTMYREGKTLADIAREHDVSTSTVHCALLRLGVERRPVGRRGKTYDEDRSHRYWLVLKATYGLDREQVDVMLVEQCGRCAMCSCRFEPGVHIFHVDHDHVTGKVRGLLCPRCNKGLSYVEDEAFRSAAMVYLEKHRGE